MTQENLGRMGESLFENLCAEVNLTTNKANNDEHGWDFIVEFPREIEVSSDLGLVDRQNIQCKVQVKATRQKKKMWQVELSNLHSMCTDTLPTFYFFVHYETEKTPQSVYLLHADKDLIFRTLQKYCENANAKNPKKTNKIKLSLNYKKNALEEITGVALKESIEKYIGSDQTKYIRDKAELLKKAGFDESSKRIHFNINNSVIPDFIDSFLGLKSKIEIHNLRGETSRFGLSQEIPCMRQSKALVSVENPKFRTGTLSLKRSSFAPEMYFEAKLYTPPTTIAPLESEYFKTRIECEFFDIIMGGKDKIFTLNMDLKKPSKLNLKEVKEFLEILKHGSNEVGEIYFSFKPSDTENKLNFPPISYKEPSSYFEELHSDFVCLLEFFSKFGSNHNIFLSHEEFERSISVARSFLHLNHKDCFLKLTGIIDSEPDKDKDLTIVFSIHIIIENQIYISVLSATGTPNKLGEGEGELELITNNITTAITGVLDKNDQIQLNNFYTEIEELIQSHAADHYVISLIDSEWFKNSI